MFGVSRMTARHAMETLRVDGVIERRHGVGSFVAARALHRQEAVLHSFSKEMEMRGLVPSSIVLEAGLTVLPNQAIVMGLDPKTLLVKIDRIRCANGSPLAREKAYLPSKYRGVLENDLSTKSLHKCLADLGVTLTHATGFVAARLATAGECELLDAEPPTPLLVESRVVTDATGGAVESTETAYLGSRWVIDTSASVEAGTGSPGVAPGPS